MLDKLTKAFSLLRQDFNALKCDVQRLEKVRPIVKHGKDGVSPDADEIVSAVLEKIPTPKDGVSPNINDIAAEAVKLIPEPKPGRDAIAPTVRDVADVVLANIEKPKDGVSPDINVVAQEAAKLIPKPKDGVSPTPEAVAEKIPPPTPGKPGKDGKDGVSVTDVQLKNNDLFVFLDGVRKKAGRIELPKQKLAFSPNNGGGGRRSSVNQNTEALGWADYADTEHDINNQFAVAANTDTILPNNGLAGVKSQEPVGVTFYSDGKITGRNGDGLAITVDFKAIPTSASTTYVEVWIDINGAVGELYRRIISFPKGNGQLRPVNFTVIGYTLDTWEQNGGVVYIRANGTLSVYDVRYVMTRTHEAR